MLCFLPLYRYIFFLYTVVNVEGLHSIVMKVCYVLIKEAGSMNILHQRYNYYLNYLVLSSLSDKTRIMY